MNFKEAYLIAESVYKDLRADDSRFKRIVCVVVEDGALFVFPDSFVEKYDEWCMIFTEHYGFHVFDSDDLVCLRQYQQRIGIDELKMK